MNKVRHKGDLLCLTYKSLLDELKINGACPGDTAKTSLFRLIQTFNGGLGGRLPQEYYLASLDTGVGKSCAIAAFLRAWKAKSHRPQGSVLIGLSSLEEIQRMVASAGLSKEDFGVFTKSDPHNALGVPRSELGSARVLFTTQQMIISRTRSRSFEEASEFHFEGKPRTLRIWDESLEPGSALTVSNDELAQLLMLRFNAKSYVQRVDELIRAMAAAQNESLLTIPPEFGTVPKSGSKEQQTVMGRLASLAGQDAIVVSDGLGSRSLVGVGSQLPEDFAPVIILDASGSVRQTYDLWGEHRGGLQRLPPVRNDYRNLTVHLWQRPCGQQALGNPDVRMKIASAVAEQINRDSASRWLIIHSKHDQETIAEIKALVIHDADQRIGSLTWGKHHGTNEFSDIPNVVVIGQLTMRSSHYLGRALAASGLPPSKAKSLDLEALKHGEYQHNLLQAASRGALRRSVHGVASKCRVFLVTTPHPKRERHVKEAFPGCQIEQWGPEPLALKGRAREVANHLRRRFADPETDCVRKGDVSMALGMPRSNLSRIIKHRAFAAFMDSEGIRQTGQTFCLDKRPEYETSLFDVIPGGFVYEEEPHVAPATNSEREQRYLSAVDI